MKIRIRSLMPTRTIIRACLAKLWELYSEVKQKLALKIVIKTCILTYGELLSLRYLNEKGSRERHQFRIYWRVREYFHLLMFANLIYSLILGLRLIFSSI